MLGGVALVAGGCTDPGQHDAARAVERHAGVSNARCTRAARLYIQAIPTSQYICDVRVGGAQCDEYRVRIQKHRTSVTLRRRRVDCLLPVG